MTARSPSGGLMLDQVTRTTDDAAGRIWPSEGMTRVPYWIFQNRDIYAAEQRRIFQGPTWNYLCLSVEVKNTGDFVTTFVGDTSVIVSRANRSEFVSNTAGEFVPCSAWPNRSVAHSCASTLSSAMISVSVGPASKSMPTRPNNCRLASAT